MSVSMITMNSVEIERLTPQLVEALQVVMDSTSPRELRAIANSFIDGFKETSPYGVECGFHLLLRETVPGVRHFGLILIEHCIKYQWNSMDLVKKVYIKDNLINTIASGTKNLLEEHYFIKNGLAKNIVEIIKREWPQQWPGLLEELYKLSALGETQAELVLLVFLILAEDVVVLNNAQSQRRREIYQSLVANLDQLFPFFTELLVTNANQYLILKKGGSDTNALQASAYCQVATSALETMAEYIDWIPVGYLIAKNGILLQMLCELLADEKLKYSAVKCILVVTSRKGKPTDRVPLLGFLWNQDCLESVFKATSLAQAGPIQESSYIFLKNICQAAFSFGSLLHVLYGAINGLELPATFSIYLDAILELTSHPSVIISSQAIHLWNLLIQHKLISQNLKFMSCIPVLVARVAPKLVKLGFPSRNDSLSCTFSKLDYDSDEDFSAAFAKLRTDCVTLLRLATVLAPEITFTYSSQWLQDQLKKPVDVGQNGKQSDGHCTLLSPSFLEWDAVSVCLESVISRTAVSDSNQTLAEEGIRLMTLLLGYPSEDPLILSSWLSCISALFPLVKHSTTVLQSVLDSIFRIVVFSTPGQSKGTRSKAVKNVRRHACSCLVKLCKLYTVIFEPFFDHIYQYVKNLTIDSGQLSQLEKCTLIEALILIKNQCKNYDKQSLFVQDILSPVASIWLSEEIKLALSSVSNFMTYIGLDCPPINPSPNDIYGIHRSRIIGCLDIILAVIKRSSWPDDVDEANRGGFIERTSEFGTLVLRNPAQEYLFSLYPHVFHLLRILNDMWLPVNMGAIRTEYASVNELTETDKNNLLGISVSSTNVNDIPAVKDPVERFKIFITGVYDSCHQIIGQSGISLGLNFYAVPNLVNYLLFSVCAQIDSAPEHRLRSLVRYLLKPLIQHCPSDYYQAVAIPLLSVFCSHVDQKFHKIWSKHAERYIENGETENDHAEAQEVIEEQLHRHMTREYLDFLTGILLNRSSNLKSAEVMEEDDMNLVIVNSESKLSELGQLIFKHKELYPSIVLCVFDALMWIDNTSCGKSLQLCLPIIKRLVDDKNLGMEEAHYLYSCLLMGLQKHGQHDSNNNLISATFQAYEIMRPIHPSLVTLILKISKESETNVKNFDDILLCQNRNKSVSEKKKKELFKALVIGIVEKSVGEIFSRKAVIKDLPPTFRPPKPKIPTFNESGLNDVGLCAFFGYKS